MVYWFWYQAKSHCFCVFREHLCAYLYRDWQNFLLYLKPNLCLVPLRLHEVWGFILVCLSFLLISLLLKYTTYIYIYTREHLHV